MHESQGIVRLIVTLSEYDLATEQRETALSSQAEIYIIGGLLRRDCPVSEPDNPTIHQFDNLAIRRSGDPAIQRSANCAIGPMLTRGAARGFLGVTQLAMAQPVRLSNWPGIWVCWAEMSSSCSATAVSLLSSTLPISAMVSVSSATFVGGRRRHTATVLASVRRRTAPGPEAVKGHRHSDPRGSSSNIQRPAI